MIARYLLTTIYVVVAFAIATVLEILQHFGWFK